VNLQVVAGRRALTAPHVFEELIGGHRVSLREGEVDEQRARTRASDVDGRAVVVEHLERPEDAELHRAHATPAPSAFCKAPHSRRVDDDTVTEDDLLSPSELAVLAWGAYSRNLRADAARLASRASVAVQSRSRRERQAVEVVCIAVGGDPVRAYGLAAEHLAEFPDDELIRRIKDAIGALGP
jgi:hypothetical protein